MHACKINKVISSEGDKFPPYAHCYSLTSLIGKFYISEECQDTVANTDERIFTKIINESLVSILNIFKFCADRGLMVGRSAESDIMEEIKHRVGMTKEVTIARGQMNKAEREIEKALRDLRGDVIGMLMFVDKTTFAYLDSVPKECGIRIIASHIKDPGKCEIGARRCAKLRPYFEITKINKTHQRWMGSEDSFFVEIGTDLKSDALGKQEHTIRILEPEVYKETTRKFHEFWNTEERELRRIYGDNLEKTIYFPVRQHREGH